MRSWKISLLARDQTVGGKIAVVKRIFQLAQTLSSVIAQAFTPLTADPLLVWLYTSIAIIPAFIGVALCFLSAGLDTQEDALNALPDFIRKQ